MQHDPLLVRLHVSDDPRVTLPGQGDVDSLDPATGQALAGIRLDDVAAY